MDFGVVMALLRSVQLFLAHCVYNTQIKVKEQSDLGMPRERLCL